MKRNKIIALSIYVFSRFLSNIKRILTSIYFGRWPESRALSKMNSIHNPERFNEKIVYKMAKDRNPQLTLFADKYRVRKYVSDLVGESYLPHLYTSTSVFGEIDFNAIPKEYVIKANHGSGAVVIVYEGAKKYNFLPPSNCLVDWNKYVINPSNLDHVELEILTSKWMKQNYYSYPIGKYPEDAYKLIEPRILVEELMLDEENEIPKDYKFFMFDGECEFIQVDSGRFQNHYRDMYDPEWNQLPFKYTYESSNLNISKPKKFEEMLEIAGTLSRGVDFLRVDLYLTKRGVKFGELTNYPDGGIFEFEPNIWNYRIGKSWKP